jgi:hypothetical protein
MITPAILSLAGLVWPTVAQGVKHLFGKSSTTEQETVGALASTNPDVIPEYVRAMNEGKDFQLKWFNRDVSGAVHWIVLTWRAAIRPFVVTCSIAALVAMYFIPSITADPEITSVLSFYVSSWMGSRPYEKG